MPVRRAYPGVGQRRLRCSLRVGSRRLRPLWPRDGQAGAPRLARHGPQESLCISVATGAPPEASLFDLAQQGNRLGDPGRPHRGERRPAAGFQASAGQLRRLTVKRTIDSRKEYAMNWMMIGPDPGCANAAVAVAPQIGFLVVILVPLFFGIAATTVSAVRLHLAESRRVAEGTLANGSQPTRKPTEIRSRRIRRPAPPILGDIDRAGRALSC